MALTKSPNQKIVKRYEKKAGLEGVTGRTLRHTMAAHSLAQGGDLRPTQELPSLQNLEQMRRCACHCERSEAIPWSLAQEIASGFVLAMICTYRLFKPSAVILYQVDAQPGQGPVREVGWHQLQLSPVKLEGVELATLGLI